MRFDFAISFAGLERATARMLAEALRADGFSVFFDEQFEHEMLGQDGADYLNDIFFRQSRYCVALISQNYEKSAWSQLERRAAQAHEHTAGVGFLIPVLVDDVKPSWLLPTRIYFNLAQRGLDELRQILGRKLFSDTGGPYQVVAELNAGFPGDSIFVSSFPGRDDFIFWCTSVKVDPQPLKRLHKEPGTGQWTISTLPLTERGRWIFHLGDRIVVVPDRGDERIRVYLADGSPADTWLCPRNYKYHMMSDCKQRGDGLLLGFCEGDVWYLDLKSMRGREIRQGEEGSSYIYVDFCNESEILRAPEALNVEILSLQDGRIVRTHETPEPGMAAWCFPEQDRAVIAGYNHIFSFSLSRWSLQRQHELSAQGVYTTCRAEKVPLFGFVTGMPFAGNALEVYDPVTGERLIRKRSSAFRGWSSLSISSSGKAIAATAAGDITIFERP